MSGCSEKKKFRVGILTFHFADNYGAVLQAYATKKSITNLGHKAEIINYRPSRLVEGYDINPFHKRGLKCLKSIWLYPYKKLQVDLFRDFRKEYLEEGSHGYSNINEACIGYDAVVVGSDQVWNLDLTGEDNAYFLANISENIVKVGFAISMGRYDAPMLERYIRDYAVCFSHLSFREEKAARICREVLSVSASVVTDPVFLLSNKDWEILEKKPQKFPYDKYILYYALEKNKMLLEKVIEYSLKTKLPIISIHPTTIKEKNRKVINLNNVGPREFLWLINHAECVGTNSFHGMAFSTIFKKKILYAAHGKLGDRNRNLLSILGICEQIDGECIDFARQNYDKINLLIDQSKDFIKSIT